MNRSIVAIVVTVSLLSASVTTLPAQTSTAPAPAANIPEQIAQLDALRAQGAISQAEFDAKKAELLGRM